MKKNQPKLIRWTPTLLMIMMILGAVVLGWNQIEFLKRPVMKASGVFLNLCMVVGIVSTLRAVQLSYITGTIIKGTLSAGIFVMLWMMGSVVIDVTEKMLYRFVLLGTFGMGIYLITTLAGKGSVVDDRFFDESHDRMKGSRRQNNRQKPQPQSQPKGQRTFSRSDFELDINN